MPEATWPEARTFLRRMLWRREQRLEPIVALLGPRGAGKSTALRALSRECGGTVVHASLDFTIKDLDPVSAVAMIAFDMMRAWSNSRYDATFHRVGLSLLALNEELDEDRALARSQISTLVKQYVRNTRQGRAATRVEMTVDASLDVVRALSNISSPVNGQVVDAVRERAKPVIGSLLQRTARWGLRDALRWHGSVPEAESAETVDWLIALSRTDRAAVASYLMRALLADIQENSVSRPPMRSECRCLIPEASRMVKHDHAWVLLVDNADTENGRRFLAELAVARCQRANPTRRGQARFDPLLVVAASDQWHSDWTEWWREPWSIETRPGTSQRPVPVFSSATHELWARRNADVIVSNGDQTACWYPVWLDSLDAQRTAELVVPRGTDPARLGRFAYRVSAGHPAAVLAIKAQVASTRPEVVHGSILLKSEKMTDTPLWKRAVRTCVPEALPNEDRRWSEIPGVIAAAGYLADRVGDAELPESLSDLSQILDFLRRHLWISTFAAQPSRLWRIGHGDAPHPAMLHPWLARCLLSGLSVETVPNPEARTAAYNSTRSDAWSALFTKLATALVPAPAQDDSRPPSTAARDRTLFYRLAQNKFMSVAEALAECFDRDDHRSWIRLLDEVTAAPCPRSVVETTSESYQRMLEPIVEAQPTVIQISTAKLVALLWLYHDPLTVQDQEWDREINDSFQRLANNSSRTDVGPLREAAARFAS